MRASPYSLFLILLWAQPAWSGACPLPKPMSFHVEREIRRDVPGFTEGLEVHDGALYESTGDIAGETRINRIDPASGRVTALVNANHGYFGEGLTFFGDRIYQMSWRE